MSELFKNRTSKLFSIEAIKLNGKQSVKSSSALSEDLPCEQLSFDFSDKSDGLGWVKNYANYPYDDPSNIYDPDYNNALNSLPFPLDTSKQSVKLKINNANSGSFAFVFKQVTLTPNFTYDLRFLTEISTNISKTFSDNQKILNNFTTVKVGATNTSGVGTNVVGNPPYYETTFDKGSVPSLSGSDMAVVGDLTNNLNDSSFSSITLMSDKFRATTDISGNLWLLVGVHSTSNILLEAYINKINILAYCLGSTVPTPTPTPTTPSPPLLAISTTLVNGEGFGEDALSQISVFVPDQNTSDGDTIYFYNTLYDPTNTEYTTMLIYVDDSPRSIVTFTSDREGTDFWYSIPSNPSNMMYGSFTAGEVYLLT